MSNTRSTTRPILIALALTALAVLLWRTSEVAIAAFGGMVGAAVWRAMARPLARWTGLSARHAVMLAVLVVAVALGAFAWAFGAQVADQIGQLEETLPTAVGHLRETINTSAIGHSLLNSVEQSLGDRSVLARIGLAAASLVSGGLNFILMLFVSIYFALDPGEYLEGFLHLLPPRRRPQVRRAMIEAGGALQKWLLAQLVAMAAVGVVVTVALAVLGVPLALSLGGIAALLEFVPVLGPVLFAIPGVLVATSQGTTTVLLVIGVYVVVQTLESNVLVPLLQRWAVRLPPVISLLAALVGAVLFGPIGLLFASPLAVVVIALVKQLYVEDTLERQPGAEAVHPSTGHVARGE